MPLRDDRVVAFTDQRREFARKVAELYPGAENLTIDDIMETPPRPLSPTTLQIDGPGAAEVEQVRKDFHGGDGVASFYIDGPSHDTSGEHAILQLARMLCGVLPVCYPIDHPMELHPEARKRFGEPDGTLKLYALPIDPTIDKYKEQAETADEFLAHNDGLGYAGSIIASMIVLDRPPLSGGYTFFSNLVRLSSAILNSDPDAYEALFLPDAITALRPRGKGAIKVTSPVLYLDQDRKPQSFLRVASGEYHIEWRRDWPALQRARSILHRLAEPFGPSQTFVHLMRPGEGVLIHNAHALHGRTAYIDSPNAGRVLARKWFVRSAEEAEYKHVPGMNVAEEYASLYPEFFRPELRRGEWNYDKRLDDNVRLQ
jgi:hypothetical protein